MGTRAGQSDPIPHLLSTGHFPRRADTAQPPLSQSVRISAGLTPHPRTREATQGINDAHCTESETHCRNKLILALTETAAEKSNI